MAEVCADLSEFSRINNLPTRTCRLSQILLAFFCKHLGKACPLEIRRCCLLHTCKRGPWPAAKYASALDAIRPRNFNKLVDLVRDFTV